MVPPRIVGFADSNADWSLFTEAAAGRMDGSVAISSANGGSYQLYYREVASIQVHISDLKPRELTGKEAVLHLLFRLGGIHLSSNSVVSDYLVGDVRASCICMQTWALSTPRRLAIDGARWFHLQLP